MTVIDAFATSPALLTATVFVLSLMIGSFLNVVIHRLPIMLDREWRAQAREMLEIGGEFSGPPAPRLQPGRATLCMPPVSRSR